MQVKTAALLNCCITNMLDLLEPINVWVFFKGATIQPYVIFWNERKIKVETINLVHSSKDGDATLLHFSVSSGGNFYRLRFDTKKLKWFMEQIEESD